MAIHYRVGIGMEDVVDTPKTLIEMLGRAARETEAGYTFLDDRLGEVHWSFARLHAEATRRARHFKKLGLQKGDRVALIVPEGEDFVLSFFGAICAGLVPVPMYPPLALGKLDGYMDTAARILETAGARMLITTKQVSPIVWSLVSRVKSLDSIMLTSKLRELTDADLAAKIEVVVDASDPCFLQFTSGSTSDPKGVVVSHGNLIANAKAIMIDGLGSSGAQDRGISWLPLYHDMGLIGFVIAPLLNQVPVVFIPTLTFVKRPATWMEVVHRYRGTITFGPNFAFGLAARRATPKRLAELDLSCLRVLGCGAEPINPATMNTFVDKFKEAGFKPEALMPCYGMAEATLAIAFDRLDAPFRTLRIDREAYENDKAAVPSSSDEPTEHLDLVACGKTFSDHDVAILDDDRRALADGQVGEIAFRGPSVTNGYFENTEATADVLADGWLHTGDLGFRLNGELYISGRKKDLIILNGRNYYPQSFEWEVEQIPGVRKGNAVAFSVAGDNTEELVVVAETTKPDQVEELTEAVANRLKDAMGIVPNKIALVGRGVLPKTSSGKLQRRKTKMLFETDRLHSAGSRAMGSTATKIAIARHLTKSAVARLSHTIKGALPLRKSSRRAESR